MAAPIKTWSRTSADSNHIGAPITELSTHGLQEKGLREGGGGAGGEGEPGGGGQGERESRGEGRGAGRGEER